ncbi:MAG: carbohydrate porin [Deltaproteobacteria bacterium]|nr:carbohydrate porin [Deltaproteobacteria bacterium]
MHDPILTTQYDTTTDFWKRNHLTGDWGGTRSKLEEKGLTFGFVYKGEFVGNTRGGLKKGATYLENMDMMAKFETEKAGWWNGGTFFVCGLANYSGNPSVHFIGDLQRVSNIEATKTIRLYELWYEQSLFHDTFFALMGQHDLNSESEFDVTKYGRDFLNSSFGVQASISANVPVSIFPATTLAVRLKWKPNEHFYLMAAAYDGNPGTIEENSTGTQWNLSSEEGAMTIYETGILFGNHEDSPTLPGSYKLGAWYHTAKFNDVTDTDASGNPVQHNGDYGGYFVADQMIYRKKGDQGLGVFFQIGAEPDDRNEVDFYVGGGVHYKGLIPTRNNDVVGLAVAHASISDKLRVGGRRDAAETTLEMTYRA